jgi:hypothetical protein
VKLRIRIRPSLFPGTKRAEESPSRCDSTSRSGLTRDIRSASRRSLSRTIERSAPAALARDASPKRTRCTPTQRTSARSATRSPRLSRGSRRSSHASPMRSPSAFETAAGRYQTRSSRSSECTSLPLRGTKYSAGVKARAALPTQPYSNPLLTPRPPTAPPVGRPSGVSKSRPSETRRELRGGAAYLGGRGPTLSCLEAELQAAAAAQVPERQPRGAEATALAECEAVPEAAEAAELPNRDDPTVCGGGARVPGLGRYRRQSLVGAATSVWAPVALEPKAAQLPGSRVQLEPCRPGVCTTRSATLGGSRVLPRGERRRYTRVVALKECLNSFRYGKCHEATSSDRLLLGKRMPERALFPYGPAFRPFPIPSSRRLPLQGRYQGRLLPFKAKGRRQT